MSKDPYLLDLPAVVSFSGGRTSGFMLRKILTAHGGQPEDLKVCFQNTGLEHEATLEFVEACGDMWGVDIVWLEYCVDEENQHAFREVDFWTASRKGEPFTALSKKKPHLPTPVARTCTSNLKMRTMDRYLKGLPGFSEGYTNAVGLRADEPRRVHRMKSDNGREEVYCPMYHAGHTEPDVLTYWKQAPFDLNLPLYGNTAGNCVGCFLKSRRKLEILMEEMPEHFEWWVEQEKDGKKFRNDRPPYAAMLKQVKRQGLLFQHEDDDTLPCMCTD